MPQTKHSRTALISATEKRQEDAIYVLLKAGSDANIADENGVTCLMLAVDGDCSSEVLQAIIDHGADVNAIDENSFTALSSACEERRVDAIHVLLKAGSDTNIADVHGYICLMNAVNGYCSKEVLQAIMDHGADVNPADKTNYTALMLACDKRHVDSIQALLKAGSYTNIADKNGWTCLMYAVYGDCSKEVLQATIDHGADMNATDKDNCTALMLACANRHVDAIHILLKAGSDTNIAKIDSQTCLMHAAIGHCSSTVLQAIIDHGVEVNATDKHSRTALILACKRKHVDAIYVLLKAGTDINIADKTGETCLIHAAIGDCSSEVLQAIIDYGADVNAIDKDSRTALIWACKRKHVDAIHVLLKAGSNTNIADTNGKTCLMYAVDAVCSKEVLQALIDHGADVNATDKNNRTALIGACTKRLLDAIHVLLKAGSDTNIADKDGNTCLMDAVVGDCSCEVLQTIIDHGADVNAANKASHTAITIAYSMRHVDAIHRLLKAGSDTNIADMNGKTYLMYAVDGDCSEELLETIIDHGPDVNATDKTNCTALMLACEKRRVDAIHVLLKAGTDTNIADKDGKTCLMCVVYEGCSEEVLQAIIDHGADVNAASKQNITPLKLASKMLNINAILLLLKAGANPIQFDETVALDWIASL